MTKKRIVVNLGIKRAYLPPIADSQRSDQDKKRKGQNKWKMKVLVGTFILFYCNTFYHCDANPIEDPGLASLMSGFAPPNHKSSLVEFEPSVQDQGPNNLKHFWHNL